MLVQKGRKLYDKIHKNKKSGFSYLLPGLYMNIFYLTDFLTAPSFSEHDGCKTCQFIRLWVCGKLR